ncbi:hypothetical protein [Pseudoalteromonas rhizosphaerae]|uniref:hypothetical protein n=1 Tax=Pseudoalteromonas rhizosphaerae TaxID=2518973 RepID=UPI00123037A1|nr:hypothetical protein [Pseudoalteromonas rhizosphaerae]
MLIKNFIALSVFLPLSFSVVANNNTYILQESYDKYSWQWAFSWLLERANAYADKKREVPDQNAMILIGSFKPELTYNSFNWEVGICGHDKRSKWLAPWVNTKKSSINTTLWSDYPVEKDIAVKKYMVSTGVPFEIESKNYKSAGLKQFASFKYSWFISEGINLDVIQNNSSHDYNHHYTFDTIGEKNILGVVYSDYDFGFSISTSFGHDGAGNYSYDGTKFKPTWGKDMGVYGCGAAVVQVEKNTRPKVVQIRTGLRELPDGLLIMQAAPILSDDHTDSDNLFYELEIFKDGKKISNPSDNKNPWFPGFYYSDRKSLTYKIVVSDGDLTTIKQGKIFE